jgi:hypothetical protein
MSLLSRLESRFGRYAMPNFAIVVIALQAALYVADWTQRQNPNPNLPASITERVLLDSEKVYEGEWWRVVTFLVQPPFDQLLFALLGWYVFYWTTSYLEAVWGAFRTNVYMLVGYLASVAAALLPPLFGGGDMVVPNVFYYGATILAFARLFPEVSILIFFVLPIKAKWIGRLTLLGYFLMLYQGPWGVRWMILAAISNYILFFGVSHLRWWKDHQRRQSFRVKVATLDRKMVHECRVCGVTSNMSPKTTFRYCSQCMGQVCYCPDHIRDHQHVADNGVANKAKVAEAREPTGGSTRRE